MSFFQLILEEQEIERKLLIQTKIISSGPSSFHCADCGFMTAYKNSLVNHIEAKHVGGVYTCAKCGREYNSKVALTMHDSRSHRDKVVPVHEQFMSKIQCLGPSDFCCSNCNFSSSTKIDIVRHLQTNLCCQWTISIFKILMHSLMICWWMSMGRIFSVQIVTLQLMWSKEWSVILKLNMWTQEGLCVLSVNMSAQQEKLCKPIIPDTIGCKLCGVLLLT